MTDQELIDLLPEGALKHYIDYWGPTTDAPRMYLVAGAVMTVGTLLRSNVYLSFGGQPIFPNLWMLLLGPSSVFRKTTSVEKARRTIATVEPLLLLPEEFSREALVRHLSGQPSGLLTSREFGGLLANLSRDYMAGTKEMLADLYDAPSTYSRLVGKEKLDVVQPCLSLFAASQTGWFLEKVREIDLQSGFLARLMYLPAFDKPPTIPIPPDPDPVIGQLLLTALEDIQIIKGKFSFALGVEDIYARWVVKHEDELLKSEHAERLSPFWTRLETSALKIAMIFQVSRDSELVMSADSLNRALDFTEWLKRNLKQLFTTEFTFTKDMASRQKVLRLITKRGADGIERRALMRAASMLKRELDPVIDTLKEESSIVVVENKADAGGTKYVAVSVCQLQSAA